MTGQPLNAREQLDAYLDGELPAEERSALERELERSPELRQELEERRELDRGILELRASEPSPQFEAGFWARLARAEEESPGAGLIGRLRAWGFVLAGPAVAAAALLLLMRDPSLPEKDWELVADAESFELVMSEDPELLEALDVLEVWNEREVL